MPSWMKSSPILSLSRSPSVFLKKLKKCKQRLQESLISLAHSKTKGKKSKKILVLRPLKQLLIHTNSLKQKKMHRNFMTI